ncbi:MAG: YidC/Oxa1 family membrane protein insertase [Chloroflexota bacterium]|nr:YidC/Oxa1 family membrane protein insertase [Chloroflexota bacterium]
MDLTSFPALLAQFSIPSIPIWDQYVQLLVQALDGLASIFHSAGIAIIAFTIIIKTIMLPLTVKSIRSSKAMQDLQPKIKELQKKHGSDRQRISQETMALYQQYQVNPMAGCLPMIIQIPIFLGLYQSITTLSNTGVGYWDQGFLWLPSLDVPDPLKILPIAAGLFQFVQTQMMRPRDQQKSTDPQQAMMNSVMNIMPLTVVFFGWSFAAGPVLYWATQSVYSVVQQWFITGWGSFHKWAPFLPELPEHKRLGYRPPRNLDDMVVMSNAEPVYGPGPMGWMQRKMAEAQKQAMERTAAPPAEAKAEQVVEAEVVPAANKGGAKARGKGKQGGNARASSARANGASSSENGAGGVPSGAVIVQRKAKPADGNSG